MDFNNNDQEFFESVKTFNLNKLLISRIDIDDDDEIKCNADVYVTLNPNGRDASMHFKPYDGTSEDIDPTYLYNGSKICDIVLNFEQDEDDDENKFFIFNTDNVKILTLDGRCHEIEVMSSLNGLSLCLASKVFLIDIFRILLNQEENNSSYQLS